MALPEGGNVSWPPKTEATAYMAYGEWSAWYSGSAVELERFYAGYAGQDRTGFFDPRTTAQPYTSIWRRFAFWARQDPGAILRGRHHIPLAADIVSTSSDLLFADQPDFQIPEAHVESPSDNAKAVQTRLNEWLDEDNALSTLSETGEIGAALGGVFLKLAWDSDFAPRPLMLREHPDAAVPEFRWGRLNAVTFWKVVQNDGKTLFRHLERHEKGAILHGLYKGTRDTLGLPVPFSDVPEVQSEISGALTDGNAIMTGIDVLTAVYIPNLLPNRGNRASYLGRSDYAGVESLMDALDETWTSWMRDIRLGKSKLLVPREYMQNLGRGRGAQFDPDKEIYELINLAPQASLKDQISPQQFLIRAAEHAATADALIARIVAASGYSAATFGLHGPENIEKTATEVKSKEKRSLVTRGKKIAYWSSALSDILYAMLLCDEKYFGGPGAFRPRLTFPVVVQESTIDMANSISLLRAAKSVSLKVSIEMLHPDWDPEEVQAEIQRLQDEMALATALTIASTPAAPKADAGAAETTIAGPPQPGQSSPATGPSPGGPQPAAMPSAAAGPSAGGPPPAASL